MTLTNEIIKAEFQKVKDQITIAKKTLELSTLEKMRSGYEKYRIPKMKYVEQIKDKKKFEEERLIDIMKKIDEDLIESNKEIEMFNKIIGDIDGAIDEVKKLTTKPEEVKKKTTSKK